MRRLSRLGFQKQPSDVHRPCVSDLLDAKTSQYGLKAMIMVQCDGINMCGSVMPALRTSDWGFRQLHKVQRSGFAAVKQAARF